MWLKMLKTGCLVTFSPSSQDGIEERQLVVPDRSLVTRLVTDSLTI